MSIVQSMRVFRHGKQGIVGLSDDNKVVKTSDRMFHIATHEYRIARSLEPVSKYCPWFTRTTGLKQMRYNPDFIQNQIATRLKEEEEEEVDEGNMYTPEEKVFVDITEKHLLLDTVFMEYVEGSITLLDLLESKVPDYVLAATIRQVIYALALANTKTGFTHYDIHSENILIRRCPKNMWLLEPYYNIVLPTYSFIPVIIDYGFACTWDTENGPITSSLAFGDYGSTPNICSETADMRFLMLGLEYDIKRSRGEFSPLVIVLADINKTLFDNLDIDKQTGWHVRRKATAVRYIERLLTADIVQLDDECSSILNDNISSVLGMIEICISLPLQSQSQSYTSPKHLAKDCIDTYKRVAKAFKIIDNDCIQNIDGVYIFRVMTRAVHEIKFNKYKFTTDLFKNLVFDSLRGYIRFYDPALDWNELYVSIIEFSKVFKQIMSIEFTFRKKRADNDQNLLEGIIGSKFRDSFVEYVDRIFCPISTENNRYISHNRTAIVSLMGPEYKQMKKSIPVSACLSSFSDTLKACQNTRNIQTPPSCTLFSDNDEYCLTDDEDFDWS